MHSSHDVLDLPSLVQMSDGWSLLLKVKQTTKSESMLFEELQSTEAFKR